MPSTPPNPANPASVLQPLAQAIDGLLYPSESDEPFDLFDWGPASGADARALVLSHARVQKPVTELTLDSFFTPLDQTDDAERFRQLRKAAEATLKAPKAFRVGTIRVEIYLMGQTHSGHWAGVHTTSVET